MSSQDTERIGPALAALRKKAGLRQQEVAQRLGVSSANVSRIEQPGSNPRMDTVLKTLEALEADLGSLSRELHGDSSDSEIADQRSAELDQVLELEPEHVLEPGEQRLPRQRERSSGVEQSALEIVRAIGLSLAALGGGSSYDDELNEIKKRLEKLEKAGR